MLTTRFAQAGLLYNYSQLKLKDLDQMSKIVRDKIKESSTAGGNPAIPLKEGLQAVFSRPDDDGMIEKLITPLKSALDEHNALGKFPLSSSSKKPSVHCKIPKLSNPLFRWTI